MIVPDDDMHVAARDEIVRNLKNDLFGPTVGRDEELNEPPQNAYVTGVLYPRESSIASTSEEEDDDEEGAQSASRESESHQETSLVTWSRYHPPSSIGISFYVRGNLPSIRVAPVFGVYAELEGKGRSTYKRKEIDLRQEPILFNAEKTLNRKIVAGTPAEIDVRWRKRGSNEGLYLITVSLLNGRKSSGSRAIPVEDFVFQSYFEVTPGNEETEFVHYPDRDITYTDPEARLLEVLYRNRKTFAVGHGCAASWILSKNGELATSLRSEVIPVSDAPIVEFTPDLSGGASRDDESLNLRYLSGNKSKTYAPVIKGLRQFLGNYVAWIRSLPDSNTDIPGQYSDDVSAQIRNCDEAARRISEGIDLLEKDEKVRRAFQLANTAMLRQMSHSARMKQAGVGHKIQTTDLHAEQTDNTPAWRHFQLAFLLLSLPSVAQNRDRDIVDLIWFPTGGGKTEAYLALTAFCIIYRRLMYREKGSGTAVLMRYTLRTLTAQQFQRAAILICALEDLRRKEPRNLGTDEISLGLYVGQGGSPNDCAGAMRLMAETANQNPPINPFTVQTCPWCNTALVIQDQKGETIRGFRGNGSAFEFFCPDTECEFHAHLPINVVDEMLFQAPPSFIIGTIDKFARLPWDDRVYSFFGNGHLPPNLIIQDELHLISGPLGSLGGLYEIAVDDLCSRGGIRPKVIASTATIRSAQQQCVSLFGRSVRLFPPAGLSVEDSYFSRYSKSKPGRTYVGLMNSSCSGVTSSIRIMASLLQRVLELKIPDEVRDNFHTLVAYYNTLRELGKSVTLANDDIPKRLKVIAKSARDSRSIHLEELTSNIPSREIPLVLERLKQSVTSSNPVDLLLCTNMISVGVDVGRLGLMLITGQPKTVAEYIQASSRVGREHPGLVITAFSPTKARDRSFYEQFTTFHDSFYKQVEPTSVTPFSKQARDRALHAVLVTLVRQEAHLRSIDSAGGFRSDGLYLTEIREKILSRVRSIDPLEQPDVTDELEMLIDEWDRLARTETPALQYSLRKNLPQFRALLKMFGEPGLGWDTLNSMRDVEEEVELRLYEGI